MVEVVTLTGLDVELVAIEEVEREPVLELVEEFELVESVVAVVRELALEEDAVVPVKVVS